MHSGMPALEPEVVALEPEVVALEPEVAALEPEVVALEPEVVALEPEVAALEPEIAALEPEVAALEPEVAALEPEVVALEPEVVALEPEVAKRMRALPMRTCITYWLMNRMEAKASLKFQAWHVVHFILFLWPQDPDIEAKYQGELLDSMKEQNEMEYMERERFQKHLQDVYKFNDGERDRDDGEEEMNEFREDEEDNDGEFEFQENVHFDDESGKENFVYKIWLIFSFFFPVLFFSFFSSLSFLLLKGTVSSRSTGHGIGVLILD